MRLVATGCRKFSPGWVVVVDGRTAEHEQHIGVSLTMAGGFGSSSRSVVWDVVLFDF